MLQHKSVAALTLGCKVNQYETDGMLELLEAEGMTVVNFDEKADVYLINTCSVTNMADKKSRQMIHRAKKINPDAIVIAAGCYAQAAKDKLEQDGQIDIIISNNRKKEIAHILAEYISTHNCIDNFVDISTENEYEPISINRTINHTRAYVKIQDGCNQFCSYCIIPYVRGRIRSRDLDSIVEEVTQLADFGVKEVVLTGIHISSYGKDKENGIYLIDVIDAITDIESIERIRLGSLEPGIITEEFVERIACNKKVCPHFHLSLQSGCNSVLKRMNRKYTREEYFEKCDMLRRAYDRPALTTDVIVGFPGETDEEFQDTVDYLEKLNLYEMHIFKYSPREGTVAAKMNNQIHPDVKNSRSDVLIDMSARHKAAYEASFVGETISVLVEEIVHKDEKTYLKGHTERYMDVMIPAADYPYPEEMINKVVDYKY
jgi:threonylcarbamoyladenosine tRNA methylthiotransferase MtaB